MSPRKGPRPEPNPKPIFQGFVIATTRFKGGEWNEANMSRWISLRKGRLSAQMDDSVTHLICSEEDVKERHLKVVFAQKRGIRNCKLVTLDWLEDSMHAKRVLPEVDFSPQKALLKAKKIEARRKQVEKGFEQAEKTVNPNLYHHYQDHTYFTYEVTLRRDHVTPGERYVLSLMESNSSRPHMYWFFAKHYKSQGNTYAHVHRPSFTCGSFEREFEHFKAFFKTKTGIDWDDRLVKEGMTVDNKFFTYTSPNPSVLRHPGPDSEARYIASEGDAQREEDEQRTVGNGIAAGARPAPQPEPPSPKKKTSAQPKPKPKPLPLQLLTSKTLPGKDRGKASGLGTARKRKAGSSGSPSRSKSKSRRTKSKSKHERKSKSKRGRKGKAAAPAIGGGAGAGGSGTPAAASPQGARGPAAHDGDGDGAGHDEPEPEPKYFIPPLQQYVEQELCRWRLFDAILRRRGRHRDESGSRGGSGGGGGGDRPYSGLGEVDEWWSEAATACGQDGEVTRCG